MAGWLVAELVTNKVEFPGFPGFWSAGVKVGSSRKSGDLAGIWSAGQGTQDTDVHFLGKITHAEHAYFP